MILCHKNKLHKFTPTRKKFQLSMSYRVGLHQSDCFKWVEATVLLLKLLPVI